MSTLTEEEQKAQSEAVMQELVATSGEAPEPGATRVSDVIDDGKDTETPIMVSSITSAGYRYVWDTENHERSVVNNNMLPQQLKKMRPNGKPYFTAIDPKVAPERGTLKCWLHESAPGRKEYAQLGLQSCPKASLRNTYQQERHMIKKHPAEYAAIMKMREDADKQRDRDAQAAQTAALLAVAEKAGGPVKVKTT